MAEVIVTEGQYGRRNVNNPCTTLSMTRITICLKLADNHISSSSTADIAENGQGVLFGAVGVGL
jgi:hypothetical protein